MANTRVDPKFKKISRSFSIEKRVERVVMEDAYAKKVPPSTVVNNALIEHYKIEK
jgi:hypothetical protein|tara:strand:- start:566 stop:730 length:165 start_codon:yes stop_codon:yes gene_type:complete